MSRSCALLLAAFAASGCVSRAPYRYVVTQNQCFAPQLDPEPGNLRRSPPFPSLECQSSVYKTAFIEFKEDGTLFDPAEQQKALALIGNEKRRLSNGKVITLVYVHGWKNNANQVQVFEKEQDVERFRLAVSELGNRARDLAQQLGAPVPVPVVGIYIGWRGKSMMGPGWLTWLSYWGRRNVGNAVGGKELVSALNAVIEQTVTSDTDPSRVMLVGHSFGARVLENAVENGVTLYDPERMPRVTPVRPRVDLVLYVNAANDARLSMQRVLNLQQQPIVVRHPDYNLGICPAPDPHDARCKEYPLIVAMTSRGDLATKYLQPIANSLNMDDETGRPPTPTPPPGSYVDSPPSGGRVRRTAPAHMRFMHSHDVEEIVCTGRPGARVACATSDSECAFAFRTRGESAACFKVDRRAGSAAPAAQVFNQTPFWIMNVDKRVIADHGDIWNLSFLSMVGELMAPRGFFHPTTAPMRIQLQ